MTKRKIREETRQAPEQSEFDTPHVTPRGSALGPGRGTEDRAGCLEPAGFSEPCAHSLRWRFPRCGAVSRGPPAMNTLVPTATSEGRKARMGLQSAGSSSLPGTDGWADVKTEIAGLDGLSETGATRITQNPEDPAHGREHGTGLLSGEELSLKKWWLPQAPFLPGPCHASSFPSEWEAGAVPPPGAAEGKGKCPGGRERPEQWHTHCELSESPESGTLSRALPGPGGGWRGVRGLH